MLVYYLGLYVSLFFYPKGVNYRFVTDDKNVEKYFSDKKTRTLREKLENIEYTFLGMLSEEAPLKTERSLTFVSDKNKSFAHISKMGKKVFCSFDTPFSGGGMLFTTNAPFPKIKGKDCLVEAFPNANMEKLANLHAERLKVFMAQGSCPINTYDQPSRIEASRQFYDNPATKRGLVSFAVKTLMKTISIGVGLLAIVGMVYFLATFPFNEFVRESVAGLFPTVTATRQSKDNTPTPTSNYTPTVTPIPTLEPLPDQMGFFDTTIQEIQENYTACRVVQQRETQSLSDTYIAYIIKCRQMSHLLVYKHETYALETNHYLALMVSDVEICFQCGGISGDNWHDVDQDGLSDLIVGRGNNYYWATYIYRMTNRGKLENLLDACPLNIAGAVPSFSDINQDGIWELSVIDTHWDYDKTDIGWYIPSVTRVYSIQNCEYQDISTSFPEFYQHTIDVFYKNYEQIVAGESIGQIGTLAAFDGVLACDAVGRREECWLAFWEMTDMKEHPLSPSDPKHTAYDPKAIELEHWVTEIRDKLLLQYEAGLPFSMVPTTEKAQECLINSLQTTYLNDLIFITSIEHGDWCEMKLPLSGYKTIGYSLIYPENWIVRLAGAEGMNLGFDKANGQSLFIQLTTTELPLEKADEAAYVYEMSDPDPLVEPGESQISKVIQTIGDRQVLVLLSSKGDISIRRYFLLHSGTLYMFEIKTPTVDLATDETRELVEDVEEMITSIEFVR